MSERPGNLVIISTGIHHINDPDCLGHQRPCKGCPDFCQIDNEYDAEERGSLDLYEAFGSYECQGEHLTCQTTEWFVDGEYWHPQSPGQRVGWSFKGTGQSIGEAMADLWQKIDDWDAQYAAKMLSGSVHGYDER